MAGRRPERSAGWPEFADFLLLVHTHFRPRREAPPTVDDDVLRRLSMPVLAVVGEDDALLDSRETARRLAAAVPHATVRLVPGGGHAVTGQGAAVLEFLRSS